MIIRDCIATNAGSATCWTAIQGGVLTGSDYNASDDGSSTGGAHDLTGQTLTYTDRVNTDLTPAVAFPTGADLRTDPDTPLTVDLACRTRPAAPTRGALENP